MQLGIDTTKTQNTPSLCPACTDLQCLERPRYFSGQLLTEAELNSEQAYMLAKSRLHNRYLHGSGVACGLQVSCGTSAGKVSIQPGFAIDPCGNDIIVCSAQEFDVLQRIQEYDKQRRQRNRSQANPTRTSTNTNCKDVERYYCLTIAYQEVETRLTNALRKGSTTSSSSSKGCGCGCQSSQSTTTTTTSSSSTMTSSQVSCEPTRISEGYLLDIVEVPVDYCGNVKDVWESTLLAKVIAGLKDVKAFLDTRLRGTNTYETLTPLAFTGQTDASTQTLYESCCRLRQAIKDLYGQDPLNTNCPAPDLFTQVVCQKPTDNGDETYMQQTRTTLYQLLALLMQYILHGICQLLIPPCPTQTEDRLTLACFTIKNDAIIDICDFCHRSSAGSFPALYRWLSLVPIAPLIAYAIERICCYDWLSTTSSRGGDLVDGLTQLLDRIDPGESLRQAIFADNFAWPRSYASRFEQIRQSASPTKISSLLHPEAFNLATILDMPVEVADMQATVKALKEELAALKNEVEQLKASGGGTTPPAEPPKS
jgi:hypothetical protein